MSAVPFAYDPAHPLAKNQNFSQGFNLPLTGDQLSQYDVVSLQNGGTKVTLEKGQNIGGGTSSIKVGNTSIFNTGPTDPGQTISFRQSQDGNGAANQQFFTTPTANSSQQSTVTLGAGGIPTLSLTQKASASNQSLATRLANLSTTDKLLIGGGVAVAVLMIVFLRK